jgi:hypothetical protein
MAAAKQNHFHSITLIGALSRHSKLPPVPLTEFRANARCDHHADKIHRQFSSMREADMASFHTISGSAIPIPAMLAVVLLSACVGMPPGFEVPSQATTSTLTRYNDHPCTPTVASALDAYHVPPGTVRDLFYTQRLSGQGQLVGNTAWMHLTEQPSSLVVDVDRSCQFEQTYTRGGANLPGVYRSFL